MPAGIDHPRTCDCRLTLVTTSWQKKPTKANTASSLTSLDRRCLVMSQSALMSTLSRRWISVEIDACVAERADWNVDEI